MTIQKQGERYHDHREYREEDAFASSQPLVRQAGSASSSADAPSAAAHMGDIGKQWGSRSYLNSIAQLAIATSVGVYAFGQVVYLSPLIKTDFVAISGPWWGVAVSHSPTGALKLKGGHPEMLRPSFFVVYAVLPLLVSLVLIEMARDGPSRRIASRFVMQVGALMRHKPRVCGILSPFGYGELLFQLFLVVGNMLMFRFGWHYERQYLPAPGDPFTLDTVLQISGTVLGYNCVFNMAFLFLPSTRNCAWMEFFDISYTNGVKYHRWLGVLTLVTGVAHAIPFYWWWGRLGTLWENSLPCFDCSLDYLSKGYSVWFNVFGELSLISLLLVGVTSIPWVRRKMFETFYYTHHLYILGVIFAVMHWVTCIWWFLPTLVVYLISRTISTWNALRPVEVVEFTALADDIIKIVVARSSKSDGSFQIGQFVYLNVPAISKLQWHAFTISSSPEASATTFTILLKSLGDWTKDLVDLAEACNAKQELPTMLVDGFYGSSLECYEDFSTVCLIGGGIGVTPLFAILEDIVAKLSRQDKKKKKTKLTQRVHFIFSFRELSLLEEVHPVLLKLRELDPKQQHFTTSFFMTRTPSDTVLDTRIDYDRLVGCTSSKFAAAKSDKPESAMHFSPQPFAEPLRSRTSRIIVYVLMLSSSTLIILWLEYGGGRLMKNGTETQWWPLENFVEISVLFVLPVVVFLVLALEKVWKSKVGTSPISSKLPFARDTGLQDYSSIHNGEFTPMQQLSLGSDAVTLRDLLSEYDVTVGQRPNMKHIMTRVHREFTTRRQSDNGFQEADKIGIFISGPEALKSAVEGVVSELGSQHFDIHEEEFEL